MTTRSSSIPYPAFGDSPQAETVVREVARLIETERQIVEALDAQAPVAAAHPEAAAAIARYRTLAQGQHDVLLEHFYAVGGTDALLERERDRERPVVTAMRRAAEATERPITAMLAADYTAFHDVALAYGLMWIAAHRAQAVSAERPTYRIGEHHQNAYAAAAQVIMRLIVDVLGWELERAGERCRCYCPCCSGLGMCICLGGGRDVMVSAWADSAVPPEQGVVVRTLREGETAARAGLRPGDVVLQVGDQEVADVWKFNPALRAALAAAPPGQGPALRVRRGEEVLTLALPPAGA